MRDRGGASVPPRLSEKEIIMAQDDVAHWKERNTDHGVIEDMKDVYGVMSEDEEMVVIRGVRYVNFDTGTYSDLINDTLSCESCKQKRLQHLIAEYAEMMAVVQGMYPKLQFDKWWEDEQHLIEFERNAKDYGQSVNLDSIL